MPDNARTTLIVEVALPYKCLPLTLHLKHAHFQGKQVLSQRKQTAAVHGLDTDGCSQYALLSMRW